MNIDCQHVTLLVLFDLSAAFDTVDHNNLLDRLQHSFGIEDTALNWFASYASNGSQEVSVDGCLSDSFDPTWGPTRLVSRLTVVQNLCERTIQNDRRTSTRRTCVHG